MGAIRGPDDHRFSVLSFDQVQRLDEVMNKPIPIHGRGNFPTLEVRLKDFVSVVRTKLEEQGVHVRDIRLNGGAASYVLLSPDDYDPDADADAEADADADVDAASDGAGSEVCYPAYSGGYRSSPAASERRPAVGGGGGTVRGRPHHQAGPARAGTGGVGGGADADVDGDADSSVGDVDSYYNPSPLPSSEVSGRDLTRSPFSLSSQHSTSSSGSSSASSTSGASGSSHPYNDLDLIFAVDLSQQRNFERVKTATLESLLDFFPEQQSDKRDRMSVCSIKEGYVHKLVKVTNGEGGDRWSLISLSRVRGRNVELKFVDSMKRQFQFSVDSFQILLDSLLLFYECAEMPMGPNFYPTVVGESMFGDFERSLAHLQNKLIATHCPEEIRGGGLLKYCNLLVRGYRAADPARIKTLERYMCSRFFIDFPDLGQQRTKLERYLWDHFAEEDDELTPSLRYQYLMTLHSVVDESTVCLMSHERKSTLFLIEELAYIYRPPNEPVYLFPPPRSYHPHHANYHPHHQQHPGNPYNGYYSNANQHHHQPRHNNNSHHHNQQHSKQHRHHHYDTYYHPQQYYYPSGFVFIPNSWMSCP